MILEILFLTSTINFYQNNEVSVTTLETKKSILREENPYFELLVLKCQFQVLRLKQRGLLSGTDGDVSRCLATWEIISTRRVGD